MALFRHAVFEISVAEPGGLPAPFGKEIAFAGRSNAGKSSAINALASKHKLAFVSKTPGRTQTINFFNAGKNRRWVDLPGYGYAKVSKDKSGAWNHLIRDYLRGRPNLRRVLMLLDSRHGAKESDLEIMEKIGRAHV